MGLRAIPRAKAMLRARARPRVRPSTMTVGFNSSVIVSDLMRR